MGKSSIHQLQTQMNVSSSIGTHSAVDAAEAGGVIAVEVRHALPGTAHVALKPPRSVACLVASGVQNGHQVALWELIRLLSAKGHQGEIGMLPVKTVVL